MIKTLILASLLSTTNLHFKVPSFLSKHKEKESAGKVVETYKARITYYTVGEDRFGSRVADPSVRRAKPGVTIAHHPRYKFGTRVRIPELKGFVGDGEFIVQDRGSAVTRKKASHGKTYVIDVFVKDKKTMKYLMRNRPMYMKVYILKK